MRESEEMPKLKVIGEPGADEGMILQVRRPDVGDVTVTISEVPSVSKSFGIAEAVRINAGSRIRAVRSEHRRVVFMPRILLTDLAACHAESCHQ